MPATVQFVDAISATASVRLDLNSDAVGFRIAPGGIDLSPPNLKTAWASTLLRDGAVLSAAAYDNRTLVLPLQIVGQSGDAAAALVQRLGRELDRPSNILKLQLSGAAAPVFFKTLRSSYGLNMLRLLYADGQARVELPADPCAYGLRQTAVAAATVGADPFRAGTILNLNPFFETDTSDWVANAGSTIVRSTAQFHEGVASLLLTPGGAAAVSDAETTPAHIPATALRQYRAQAWVRCAVSRNINLNIDWYTGANAFISSSTRTLSVTLNTWTFMDVSGIAPANAGRLGLSVMMDSTPPASNLLHIDEAWVAPVSDGGNGCYVDIPAGVVIGDVETPADITINSDNLLSATTKPKTLFAIRRRGAPANMPLVLQAEAMTQGTNTTTQPADANFSGTGNNFSRCTFGTPGMTGRLSQAAFPSVTPSKDYRGTYKVLARVRQNTGSDVVKLQFQYSYGTFVVTNDTVTVPGSITVNQLVELGLCTFPVGADPVTDGAGAELPVDNGSVTVQLNAQRVSGAGTLDFDYLLFVPADDRLALVDWPDETASGLTCHLDGITEQSWVATSAGNIWSFPPFSPAGRFINLSPLVAQRLYIVPVIGNVATETVSQTYTVSVSYLPRYLFIRPGTG